MLGRQLGHTILPEPIAAIPLSGSNTSPVPDNMSMSSLSANNQHGLQFSQVAVHPHNLWPIQWPLFSCFLHRRLTSRQTFLTA